MRNEPSVSQSGFRAHRARLLGAGCAAAALIVAGSLTAVVVGGASTTPTSLPAARPDALSVSSDASTALISLSSAGISGRAPIEEVLPVNLGTGTVGRPVLIPPSLGSGTVGIPSGSAFVRGTATAWVTFPFAGDIAPLNVETRQFGTPVHVAIPSYGPPWSIAVASDGQHGWLTSPTSNLLTPVNLSNGAISDPITVGPPIPPGNGRDGLALALAPDGATLWVAELLIHQLVPVNTATGAVGLGIDVPGLRNAIAVSPDGASIWAMTSAGLVTVSLHTTKVSGPVAGIPIQGDLLAAPITGHDVWAIDTIAGGLLSVDATTGARGLSLAIASPQNQAGTPTTTPSTASYPTFVSCGIGGDWDTVGQSLAQQFGGSATAHTVCGRWSTTDTWEWLVPGSATLGKTGGVAVYRCAAGDQACLSSDSAHPQSGWMFYPAPTPGVVLVISTAARTPEGTVPGLLLASSPTSDAVPSAAPYIFDPVSVRYLTGNGIAAVAAPTPVPVGQ